MTTNPTVSIIMATYNRANFIHESLVSIVNQTFSDWECIIIDDGGTDNTEEVIAEILQNDNRFSYRRRTEHYQKNLPGCRNYGLDIAKGKYIIFFDDDDIAHPQNLEICVAELDQKDISFCHYVREAFTGDFVYDFDYSKEYSYFSVGLDNLEAMLKNDLFFNSCAVMWRSECFDNKRFVEHLKYNEEWELYTRIVSEGFEGISISKSLYYGRKHWDSMTGEYYSNDPGRKKSYGDAIVIALKNLVEKKLLTYPILRYFIVTSYGFREFKLFNSILQAADFSLGEKFKWTLFYKSIPLRFLYIKVKKSLKKTAK